MFKWFKKRKHYHVAYVCTKNGVSQGIFADQLVVTNKKIDGHLLQDLRDNAKEEYGYDGVAILNIIKL